MKPYTTRRTNSWPDLAPASRIYSSNQMLPTSSTLEQPLSTRDSVRNCEESSAQTFSQPVMANHVHHPPSTSDGGCFLAHSPPPSIALCQESIADVAFVPPSPSFSAKNGFINDDCKTTTPSTASSDVTPSIGFIEPVFPLSEPERLAMSRNLLPLPLGSSQSSQENLLDVAPVDFPCDEASSNDPRTALLPTVLGRSPCLVPESALEIETSAPDDMTDDAELSTTRRVTFTDHQLPSGPTTTVSSPDTPDKMDLPLVDSDAHFTPCEVLIHQNIQSHSYKARTPEPALSPTFDALLTPQLTVDTLAWDSSPSHPEPNSDIFMDSTPPLSSPQIECNATVIEDRVGDREADLSDHAKIDYYPAMTMSSPNFTLHGDESLFPSSPPHQTTSAKRALYDDSDEEQTSAKPVKRIRTDETMSSPLRNPPAPRRATLAAQKLSRKKLAAPFRSPLQTRMTSTSRQPTTPALLGEDTQEEITEELRAVYQTKPKSAQRPPAGTQKIIKPFVRSSRVAAQFRSPLVKAPVDTSRPLVLPNQTLMNLERKVTILRRALKIKRDGDEGHLERLSKKWRDAGREAAYELWGIVRDLSTEGCEIRGNGNGNASGWGWDDQDKHGMSGEDGLEAEEGEHVEEKQESTLGVMLRKLGIAPETLGWNEVEEAFVDNE